jgi:hypothetical protein
VQEYLVALPGDQKLLKKASGPFAGDTSLSAMRVLRWTPSERISISRRLGVELGRICIITEVSMLSTHLCLPRVGHLEDVFHVFAYLVLHHNTRVVFDPTYPSVDMGTFIKTDWKSIYGDAKDMITYDAPVPHGKEVDLRLFVDSDHVGDQFTRRSLNGFVIYLNMAPLVWFSKHHPTVDSSIFGADFLR